MIRYIAVMEVAGGGGGGNKEVVVATHFREDQGVSANLIAVFNCVNK